ncbi:MAG: ParB/RepB/Spo0J family partition protein [Treponema sp.]|jgi:ParB family chromosome partitioning protein|nr:ParB/RepB/Spo0J family partition protein [Treponema sp.]
MARRIGLGRGLNALLDNNDDDDLSTYSEQTPVVNRAQQSPQSSQYSALKSDGVVQLPVSSLVPHTGQPRKNFDETELNELAASIKTYGIIQPIIAANAGDGSYIIIAGERRTRAARIAGLETVPAIIREYTDQKRLEVSLIENVQRSDLNPIEEAAAFKNAMDFSGLSQDELAMRVGKKRSTVANALRLLKLPVEMQKSIEEGSVSPGHARALLSITESKAREKLYREILKGDVSVREAEKRASLISTAPETKNGKKSLAKNVKRPPEVDAMAERFITKLGTKVVIEGDLNKGRLLIDYYSMEDLERLYEIIMG